MRSHPTAGALRAVLLLFALVSATGARAGEPKVALVLSGGGARGLAHVGVLRALEEAGLYPDLVVGCSIGSVVGGLYASGRTPAEMESLAHAIDWDRFFTERLESRYRTLPRERRERPGLFRLTWSPDQGVDLAQPLAGGASAQETYARLSLAAEVASEGSFDSLATPFRAAAADLLSGRLVLLDRGSLSQAIAASSAIPLFFDPVITDSMWLADGGVIDNFPIGPARSEGADIVIGVDVGKPLPAVPAFWGPGTVFWRAYLVMSRQTKARSNHMAQVLITPKLGFLSTARFDIADSLIRVGYEAGRAAVPRIRATLDSAGVSPGHLAANGERRIRVRRAADRVLADRRVGRWLVAGLNRYPERAVRGEFRLQEGDPWDLDAALAGLGNLQGSGRFRSASLDVRRAGEHDLQLTARVAEAPALELGLGLRADTEQGWEGVVQLEHRNLLGAGTVGHLEVLGGQERQMGLFQLEVPFLLPAGLVPQARAFAFLEQPEQFVDGHKVGKGSLRRLGVDALEVGKLFGRHARLSGGLRREWTHADAFALTGVAASDESYTSLRFEAAYLWGPPRAATGHGIDASFLYERAWKVFAGDVPFHRYELAIAVARPGFLGGHVGGHLDLGFHDRDVAEPRRFRLGGPESLAGLPVDAVFASQRVSAGLYVEPRIAGPLHSRLGFDLGGVWDRWEAVQFSDLEGGWQAGLRFETFAGPIALDYGRAAGEQDRWIFSVGYAWPPPSR